MLSSDNVIKDIEIIKSRKYFFKDNVVLKIKSEGGEKVWQPV